MKFTVQIIIDDERGQPQIEDVIQLNKDGKHGYNAGLSLAESKQLLKSVQEQLVLHQAKAYVDEHIGCPCCHKARRIKGYGAIQYKTLFGTVVIPSLRLYHCKCHPTEEKTLTLLHDWLPEHTSPELQYIETRWASYMSFQQTSKLLQDILPLHGTLNGSTIRNHLHKIAKRQESELEEKPACISGCAKDWAKLPKPDKPLVVGIDGGYVRNWNDKQSNFEVIIGKSFSKTKSAKRFGMVQSMDNKPQRRLLNALREQGMQENQQITFLSDGADNVRDLQFMMHPESEHILDWFHITMRITVLNQFSKGFIKSDPKAGEELRKNLERIKWYLWHGNVKKALDLIEECYLICMDEDLQYVKQSKLLKQIEELSTYIHNNQRMIPNYGERWRYGETITTSFVESTVNEVVTKRMVKKQQMQWTSEGAHYLLQVRTAALNDDLDRFFERWYPGLNIKSDHSDKILHTQQAA